MREQRLCRYFALYQLDKGKVERGRKGGPVMDGKRKRLGYSRVLKIFSDVGGWWSEIKYSVSPHPFMSPRETIQVWDSSGTGRGQLGIG